MSSQNRQIIQRYGEKSGLGITHTLKENGNTRGRFRQFFVRWFDHYQYNLALAINLNPRYFAASGIRGA